MKRRHYLKASFAWGLLGASTVMAEPSTPEMRALFFTQRGGPRLRVLQNLRTGVQPKSVSVSSDGSKLAVCNFGYSGEHNVFLYDAHSMQQSGELVFPGNAVESVFSRDGRRLFVSVFSLHRVHEIEVASGRMLRTFDVGRHPKMMVLNADETRLYVANWGSANVSVIDLTRGQEVRRLQTLQNPRGLCVLPNGELWVAAFAADTLHVFEPDSAAESKRMRTNARPRHLVASGDGRIVYVSYSSGSIGFLDARTGSRLGFGRAGRNPRSISIEATGRYLSVANFSSNDVSILDTQARTHCNAAMPGAGRMVGIAMAPNGPLRIYATDWDHRSLIVLGAD